MSSAPAPGAAIGTTLHEGDAVRVKSLDLPGHVRTPRYLLGAVGRLGSFLGAYANPERLAYGDVTGPPARLHRVVFRMVDVFDDYAGAPDDVVTADIYEHWLEKVAADD